MVMLEGKKGLWGAMKAKTIGSGAETLVLAHGYGTGQSLWDDVVPGLAEKHRVVVFDWNFSGEALTRFEPDRYTSLDAYSDDLVGLMDEMGLRDCVLVGHSMSAMVGCIASVKRPDLFKHLILIGASPRYLNAQGYEGGFEKEEVEKIFWGIESDIHGWAAAFSAVMVGEDDPLAIHKLEACLKSMHPDVALAVAKLIFLGDYRDRLADVSTACTIVKMNNDLAVPDSVACYMQRKMVKAKPSVQTLDVNGHFPMLTAPSQLLHLIHTALASSNST